MTIDMYSERVAEASALIREFAKVDYFHYFARDPESSLEAFIAMLDQAEEKGRQSQAACIAELERQLAEASLPVCLIEPIVMPQKVHVHHIAAIAKCSGIFGLVSMSEIQKFALALLNEFATAAPSAPSVEQQPVGEVWVDINGTKRAWVHDQTLAEGAKLYTAPQAADTDKVREAMNKLHADIMNLPCTRTMSHFATTDDMKIYKQGHRDARHAAAELVASMAGGMG